MKRAIILRGTSNAGKTTLSDLFPEPKVVCCADDYFTDVDGNYNFNANYLNLAHSHCKEKFVSALKDDNVDTIVVANTNTTPKEFGYYTDKAEEMGIMVFSLVVERRHESKNHHNVPFDIIERQSRNITNNLKLI